MEGFKIRKDFSEYIYNIYIYMMKNDIQNTVIHVKRYKGTLINM